ncbi:MAG: DMT family transporter [Alphaproteobacteria bacterium]
MRRREYEGIIAMLSSSFFFSLMNIGVSLVSPVLNSFYITLFRQFFALLPVAIFIYWRRDWVYLKTKRLSGHFLRSLLGTISMVSYFYSFKFLPITEVISLSYTRPLFLCLLSPFLLQEKVSLERWLLVCVGFMGVAIMLQPEGQNFNGLGVAIGLLAAFFSSLVSILIRQLGQTEKSSTIVFYYCLFSSVFMLPVVGANKAQILPADQTIWWILMGIGLVGGIGQMLITKGLSSLSASLAGSLEYGALLWITLFQYLFFHQLPAINSLLGALVIVSSGVMLLRKRR